MKRQLELKQYNLLKELNEFYHYFFDQIERLETASPKHFRVLHNTGLIRKILALLDKFSAKVKSNLLKDIQIARREFKGKAPFIIFPKRQKTILREIKTHLDQIRYPLQPSVIVRRFIQELRADSLEQFETEFSNYLNQYEASFDILTQELIDISTVQVSKLNLIKRLIKLFKKINVTYKIEELQSLVRSFRNKLKQDMVDEKRIGAQEETIEQYMDSLEGALLTRSDKRKIIVEGAIQSGYGRTYLVATTNKEGRTLKMKGAVRSGYGGTDLDFHYDSEGNLVRITGAIRSGYGGTDLSLVHDSEGRTLKMKGDVRSGYGGTDLDFHYDSEGNLVRITGAIRNGHGVTDLYIKQTSSLFSFDLIYLVLMAGGDID